MNQQKVSVFNSIVKGIIFILVFTGCQSKEVEIPSNIIPIDTMVQIQADVELIEAYLLSIRLKSERDSIGIIKYNELFQKHDLNREEYQRNLTYYLDHEVQMRELYTKTLEELNRREAEMKAGKK
jgi:hypothetical protein